MRHVNVIHVSVDSSYDPDHLGNIISKSIEYANTCTNDQINIVKVQLDGAMSRSQISDYITYFESYLCPSKNILITTIT